LGTNDGFPGTNDKGQAVNVIGYMVDITHFKFVEQVQEQRVYKAGKSQRQQENYRSQ